MLALLPFVLPALDLWASLGIVTGAALVALALLAGPWLPEVIKTPLVVVGVVLTILVLTWQFGVTEGFKRGTEKAVQIAEAAEVERRKVGDAITEDLARDATDQLAVQQDLITNLEGQIRDLRKTEGRARVCIDRSVADRLRELRRPGGQPALP